MKLSTFVCKPCKLGVTHIKILYGIFSIKIRRYEVDLFIASVRKLNCSASTFEFPLFNARDIPSSKEANIVL